MEKCVICGDEKNSIEVVGFSDLPVCVRCHLELMDIADQDQRYYNRCICLEMSSIYKLKDWYCPRHGKTKSPST